MSWDSVEQLSQGRAGAFTDWHPPVMSLLWGWLDRILPGPAGMLIFHNLLFWSGLSLIAVSLFGHSWRARLAIPLVGFFPSVVALLGVVWKDVGLGAALSLAVGLLAVAASSDPNRKAWRTIALAAVVPCLFYALAVRHNGLPALLPLVIWLTILAAETWFPAVNKPRRISVIIATAVMATGLLYKASKAATFALSDHKTHYPGQVILTQDLVALSINRGENLLPAFMRAKTPLTLDELKAIYVPGDIVKLYCCSTDIKHLELSFDEKEFGELTSTWLATIPKNLGAYFAHRFESFDGLMRWSFEDSSTPYFFGVVSNEFGIESRRGPLQEWWMARLTSVGNTLAFRPWIYLVWSAALTTFGLRRRLKAQALPAFLVGASALGYGSAYLFVATSCDFRMMWWPAYACAIGTLFVAADLRPKRSRGRVGLS